MITPEEIHALQFTNSTLYEIIAQDDDNDYSESGWVAIYDPDKKKCAISRYSHCSCYGTWEAIKGWDWEGTPKKLLKLAKKELDPNMPERKISPEDYDYDHLMNVYQGIINWYNEKFGR
jgi:hypothetical protein